MKKYFILLTSVVAIASLFIGCATPRISIYGNSADSLVKILTDVPDGFFTTYYLTIEKNLNGKVVEASTIEANGVVIIPFGEYHIVGTATANPPFDDLIASIIAASKKKDLGIVSLERGGVYMFRRTSKGGKFLYFGTIEDDPGEISE
jgi:hypothetical protein